MKSKINEMALEGKKMEKDGGKYVIDNGNAASLEEEASGEDHVDMTNPQHEESPDSHTKAEQTKDGTATDTRKSPDGNKVQETQEKDVEMEVDTKCGYGSWTPACLQKGNNSKMLLFTITIFSIVQGFVVNGINNSNTTSMERRFGFSSLEVSLISSAYDFSAGLFVIPIGYYGRFGHKPRWLATTCLIMGIGSCTMFLPHVISGAYEPRGRAGDTCEANGTACTNYEESGMYGYLAILIFGQFLHGIGGTTLYTLGIVWIDDNVKLHQVPLYVGIMEAGSALGPALGFVVGGMFLDIYVDVDTVDTSKLQINENDPRWVGAWWIGLLLSGVMAILWSLLIYCFGWELPDAAENRKTRFSQAHRDGSEQIAMRPGFGLTLKDLPKSTWLLLKNPTFMLLNCSGIASIFLVVGYGTFMPKFIQNQFQQRASWASLVTGFVAVPALAGGQLVGGIIPAKMNLKVRGMLIVGIISFAICLLPMPVLFARCPPSSFAGVNVLYGNSSTAVDEINLTSQCNQNCSCTSRNREPVCGADGVEYFSGCHAGCTGSVLLDENKKNYTDCACISDSAGASLASSGLCPTDCGILLPVFCVLMFVVTFTLVLPLTPLVTVTLRAVPESLSGYALAVQWLFMRFFGSVPGPILFGLIMDSSCTVWQDKCGERGSCWLYDSYKMGWTIFVFSVGLTAAGLIFMVLSLLVYKPPLKEDLIEASSADGLDNLASAVKDDESFPKSPKGGAQNGNLELEGKVSESDSNRPLVTSL